MQVKGSMMLYVAREIHSLIAGWLERTLELAGGRNAKVEIIARSWSGDPATVFHATWA